MKGLPDVAAQNTSTAKGFVVRLWQILCSDQPAIAVQVLVPALVHIGGAAQGFAPELR